MKQSAGILVYKRTNEGFKFLLVHPGGPLHVNRDFGAWSIPKGEFTEEEDALDVAKKEFHEEIGQPFRGEKLFCLKPIKQKGGKTVHAWAAEGELDISNIQSNTFKLEWPPRSGKWIDAPEVDRAEWFTAETAKQKINPAQAALIDELLEILNNENQVDDQ